MHNYRTKFFVVFLMWWSAVAVNAATVCPVPLIIPDTMPRIFVLGDQEKEFEALQMEYEYSLLSVCNNDYDSSFVHWVMMLKQMEEFGDSIDFDLKGIKMWVQVFWDPDGSIRHIGYYLKPNSKNIRKEEMAAFFKGFINHYKSPLVTTRKYSNYASANFPTLPLFVDEK